MLADRLQAIGKSCAQRREHDRAHITAILHNVVNLRPGLQVQRDDDQSVGSLLLQLRHTLRDTLRIIQTHGTHVQLYTELSSRVGKDVHTLRLTLFRSERRARPTHKELSRLRAHKQHVHTRSAHGRWIRRKQLRGEHGWREPRGEQRPPAQAMNRRRPNLTWQCDTAATFWELMANLLSTAVIELGYHQIRLAVREQGGFRMPKQLVLINLRAISYHTTTVRQHNNAAGVGFAAGAAFRRRRERREWDVNASCETPRFLRRPRKEACHPAVRRTFGVRRSGSSARYAYRSRRRCGDVGEH